MCVFMRDGDHARVSSVNVRFHSAVFLKMWIFFGDTRGSL